MPFDKLKKILLRLYFSYSRKYIWLLIGALALSMCVAGSTAAIAWLLDPAIKKMFIDQDKSMMIFIPIAIVSAFMIKGYALYNARIILIKIASKIVYTMQNQLSSSYIKSDLHELESRHSGEYVSHIMFDVGQVNALVTNGVLNIMKDPLTLIVLVSLMFYQNWKLAIFALIMMPLAAIVAKSLGKRMGKAVSERAKINASLTTYFQEMLKGSRMVRIFQRENFELGRADKILTKNMHLTNKVAFIMIRAQPIMEVITGFMIAGFIYYSGFMIASGEMGINNFFSFLTAMMLAYQPVRSLATLNMMFYQGAAGAERVFRVLDEEPSIKEIETSPNLNISSGGIEFKNIGFTYRNTKVAAIKNINISIKGGSTAALVGHSGSGKSTIINLIPRFFDPKEGTISIDGQNIHKVSLSSLRNSISMVSQDIMLFDDTIYSNIAYAKLNASKEDIKKACDFAAASDFIEKLPGSYETLIGENGIRLSGGQKQRISIARAFLKNSPIILLDEATSSLDAESEEKVQNAVANLTKNKTTLVIAHRLSTIIKADKIFILNQGEIAGIGSHNDLLKSSALYKNLYSKQLTT